MKVAVGLRRVAAGKRTSGRRAAQIAATADCRWLRCTIVISLCGQGISCPSFLCLVDGVAFYHLILGRKKAGDLFQISCSVCRCVSGGYLVVKVRNKLTRCIRNNKPEVYKLNLLQQKCKYSLTDISLLFKIPIATNITSATVR